MAKDRSKRAILEHYADAGFRPPDNWNVEDLSRVEVGRLAMNAFTGCVAAETPRRLGEGASSLELAGDKFLSKGVANTYWVLWRRLTVAKNAPLPVEDLSEDESWMYPPETWMLLHARALSHPEAKRQGRIVLWDRWWTELKPRLLARRRALATFAMREDRLGWGYRIVTGIGSELEWIDGKFDDYQMRYGEAFDYVDVE